MYVRMYCTHIFHSEGGLAEHLPRLADESELACHPVDVVLSICTVRDRDTCISTDQAANISPAADWFACLDAASARAQCALP